MSKRMSPFANGSEFSDWLWLNCEQCPLWSAVQLFPDCELHDALLDASIDDGTIDVSIAERIGFNERRHARCKKKAELEHG